MTLAPRRDPVPLIDAQGGLLQHIECAGYKAWSCHSAIRSLCELYHSCGAERVRNVAFVRCLCVDGDDWNNCTLSAATAAP